VEQLRLVAAAGIGEDRHDRVAGADFAGEPDRAADVDAGRAAENEALLDDQLEQHRQHLRVGDLVLPVGCEADDVAGFVVVADALGDRIALGLPFTAVIPAVETRPHQVGQIDLDVAVAFLERDTDTGQRAAGAHRADKAVDLAVGLRPDLGAGGLVVTAAVGEIVELGGPDRAVRLGGRDLLRQSSGIAGIVHRSGVRDRRHEPQIDAARKRHVLFFLALRLRHHNDGAIAAGVADQRQADAGVAGGPLDYDPTGPKRAALLGVFDDVERSTVLDRAAGIQKLGLAEDGAARLFRRAAQLDQRRVADSADKAVSYIHASPPDAKCTICL